MSSGDPTPSCGAATGPPAARARPRLPRAPFTTLCRDSLAANRAIASRSCSAATRANADLTSRARAAGRASRLNRAAAASPTTRRSCALVGAERASLSNQTGRSGSQLSGPCRHGRAAAAAARRRHAQAGRVRRGVRDRGVRAGDADAAHPAPAGRPAPIHRELPRRDVRGRQPAHPRVPHAAAHAAPVALGLYGPARRRVLRARTPQGQELHHGR